MEVATAESALAGFSVRLNSIVRTPATLDDLAQQCNPTIRGCWNYFGAFYRTAMYAIFQSVDRKLERWARWKFETLSRHKRRSAEWLRKTAAAIHGCSFTGVSLGHWLADGSRMRLESHVRFRGRLEVKPFGFT
ncbi:group II intron maturase-specific domain-containing protein [Caballeronia sp. 15711]|uniref:group II intron maturase-specific domain-containing protein n=1 Tax=Caballeronia sp. 15711 TaxID=3391029 RepID=UPI0039E4E886